MCWCDQSQLVAVLGKILLSVLAVGCSGGHMYNKELRLDDGQIYILYIYLYTFYTREIELPLLVCFGLSLLQRIYGYVHTTIMQSYTTVYIYIYIYILHSSEVTAQQHHTEKTMHHSESTQRHGTTRNDTLDRNFVFDTRLWLFANHLK